MKKILTLLSKPKLVLQQTFRTTLISNTFLKMFFKEKNKLFTTGYWNEWAGVSRKKGNDETDEVEQTEGGTRAFSIFPFSNFHF